MFFFIYTQGPASKSCETWSAHPPESPREQPLLDARSDHSQLRFCEATYPLWRLAKSLGALGAAPVQMNVNHGFPEPYMLIAPAWRSLGSRIQHRMSFCAPGGLIMGSLICSPKSVRRYSKIHIFAAAARRTDYPKLRTGLRKHQPCQRKRTRTPVGQRQHTRGNFHKNE